MQTGPSSIEPEGLLDGLRWGAIVYGALLDLAITFVVVIMLIGWVGGEAAFSSDQETSREAIEAAGQSSFFAFASFVVGLLATVFGGFFGAMRAGVHHVRHGGWVAVVSAGLGLLLALAGGGGAGAPIDLLSFLLMIPAGVLGGYLASRIAAPAEGPGPPTGFE